MYMSNEFIKQVEKEIKCEACSEFNKFYNTQAQMLVSIYHMTSKLLKNHIFCMKTSRFPLFYTTL